MSMALVYETLGSLLAGLRVKWVSLKVHCAVGSSEDPNTLLNVPVCSNTKQGEFCMQV